MTKYYVEIPIVLKFMTEVEADSKEEAVEKVIDSYITIDIKESETNNLEFIDYEWEFHKKVVQGNVYYGGINEVYIEELDED